MTAFNQVTHLTATCWADLADMEMDNWMWLAMDAGGIHRADRLPADAPPQVSHVWGWSREVCVAVRLDPDLPNGMVGARLGIATALADTSWRVSRQSRNPIWPHGDAHVNHSAAPDFYGEEGQPLWDIECIQVSQIGAKGLATLDFLRLVPCGTSSPSL